jgi:hypothetical protein
MGDLGTLLVSPLCRGLWGPAELGLEQPGLEGHTGLGLELHCHWMIRTNWTTWMETSSLQAAQQLLAVHALQASPFPSSS